LAEHRSAVNFLFLSRWLSPSSLPPFLSFFAHVFSIGSPMVFFLREPFFSAICPLLLNWRSQPPVFPSFPLISTGCDFSAALVDPFFLRPVSVPALISIFSLFSRAACTGRFFCRKRRVLLFLSVEALPLSQGPGEKYAF